VAKKPSYLWIAVAVLLPFVSILGVSLVNLYSINTLLLVMLATISFIMVLVAFGKLEPASYPFLVLAIAMALLYHFSLISPYPVGWDGHSEYYFYKLVAINSYWNPTVPDPYNSALSITILPVIYSRFMGIDGVWIFKIIHPFIYSLASLGLYEFYRKQTNSRIAFLSVIFFMSVFTFFNEMPSLARQEIATFFIVMLMLLTVERSISPRIKTLLLLLFSAAVVVSHYGTTYLYILYLVITGVFLFAVKNSFTGPFLRRLRKSFDHFSTSSKHDHESLDEEIADNEETAVKPTRRRTETMASALFLVVFALVWYVRVSSSAAFLSVVHIGMRMYDGLVSGFLATSVRDISVLRALGMGSGLIIRWDSRIVLYVTEFFIVVGVAGLVVRIRKSKFTAEFKGMALAGVFVLAMCVIFPYFAASLNISRINHFTTLFLAPFCILGGEALVGWVVNLPKHGHRARSSGKGGKRTLCAALVISTLLVAYFLFNTGFIYEVTGDIPSSVPLSLGRMNTMNNTEVKVWLRSMVVSRQDVSASMWLYETKNSSFRVYSDYVSAYHVLRSYGMVPGDQARLLASNISIYGKAYVYLGQLNVQDGIMTGPQSSSEPWNTNGTSSLLQPADKIYSNGLSEIYFGTWNGGH
jgi:uncharacterized membrane protein